MAMKRPKSIAEMTVQEVVDYLRSTGGGRIAWTHKEVDGEIAAAVVFTGTAEEVQEYISRLKAIETNLVEREEEES